MALITCPECGQKISDTAAHCIYCGYVLHAEQTPAPLKAETAAASANTVAQTPVSSPNQAKTATATTDLPETTTEELYEEWLNEPTTHRTFANKNWKWLFRGIYIPCYIIALIFFILSFKSPSCTTKCLHYKNITFNFITFTSLQECFY